MDESEWEPINLLPHEQETRKWNVFENSPVQAARGSTAETKWIDFGEHFGKVLAYIFSFTVVLGGAVVSKGCLLFMTSQLNVTAKPHCNETLDIHRRFTVTLPEEERIAWIWILLFTYLVPQVGTLFRSMRILLHKSWKTPSFREFAPVFLSETCSTIGNAILIFVILPRLDVIKGVMLTNGLSFTPAVLMLTSKLYGLYGRSVIDRRDTIKDLAEPDTILKLSLDVLSIVIQATVLFVWPLIENDPVLWCIPAAALLISCGWWENFTLDYKNLHKGLLRDITKPNRKFMNSRYFTYMIVSMWKCVLFFSAMIFIEWCIKGDASPLFDKFPDAFSAHEINITEIPPNIIRELPRLDDVISINHIVSIYSDYLTPVWLFIISFCATYFCYAFGKFACKVYIQDFSYAFPINLVVPVTITGLIAMCGLRNNDPCYYTATIPSYLFFNVPEMEYLDHFIGNQHTWIWLFWLLSQAWITRHIWRQKNERLAKTERLYVRPMYEPFVIDQDLAMNRRILDEPLNEGNKPEDLMIRQTLMNLRSRTDRPATSITENDSVTRIYACGTMWHETKEEMVEFLKSILRLDEDQCARRIVKAYLDYPIPDYYELETHIFFDDAFVRVSQDDPDPQINGFVKDLLEAVDEAASQVHKIDIKVRPPIKHVTPYGGKLVWTLPGKTKLIAHLKDKKKIRAKKRWSQIMYMYYLLGHGLMERDELDEYEKTLRSNNTYLLALDGDIDFQPKAVHLLVDLMKKDMSVGAACGRIHPMGSGPLVWYQMFEYAIGHWLQKATEHVIGSVLCSPGCFSMFRGSALMDLGVMKRYATKSSEALHYVQFDQGEDRWLCTLLLQRGYRVEYAAASDAYTHCPEGFIEFFNQRRRWVPSTIANIFDLLINADKTIKINNSVSRLYIGYHLFLMIGTVLGPGTIFLMLVGALGAVFHLSPWSSLLWNMIPVMIFVITCAVFAKDQIQLLVAGILSGVYSLVMMAVLVGIVLQMINDGVLAPSSLFFFCVAGQIIITALLHPKELNCLKYGVVYYVTVPCMYMILVIYSVFNMNNVSWGTREVTVVAQAEVQNNNSESKDKKSKSKLKMFGSQNDDDDGGFQFALGNLFKCLCFTSRNTSQYNQNREILARLEAIEQRQLEVPEKEDLETEQEYRAEIDETHLEEPEENYDSTSTLIFDNTSGHIPETSWLEDEALQRAEVGFISSAENEFWKGMLELYLHPVDDSQDKARITENLKALRDKAVIGFFMLNALFVLTIFLLTLNSDVINIRWPLGVKATFRYIQTPSEIRIYKEYIRLEPIGVLFLLLFASILLIQFIAMLVHRLQTFSQIVANTKLNIGLFERSANKLSEEEIVEMNPVEFVRSLQQLKGADNTGHDDDELINAPPARRPTIFRLQKNVNKNKNVTNDLEDAFRRRTAVAADYKGPLSRTTVDVIVRRKTIVENKKSVAFFLPAQQPSTVDNSSEGQGQINHGYVTEV